MRKEIPPVIKLMAYEKFIKQQQEAKILDLRKHKKGVVVEFPKKRKLKIPYQLLCTGEQHQLTAVTRKIEPRIARPIPFG
jgi:hypothetical protein